MCCETKKYQVEFVLLFSFYFCQNNKFFGFCYARTTTSHPLHQPYTYRRISYIQYVQTPRAPATKQTVSSIYTDRRHRICLQGNRKMTGKKKKNNNKKLHSTYLIFHIIFIAVTLSLHCLRSVYDYDDVFPVCYIVWVDK